MIGTSIFDYLFIRACIVSLHSIAPISISYCLAVLLINIIKPAWKLRLPLLLEIWAVLEAAFFFLVYLYYKRSLQLEAIHPPAPTRQERQKLLAMCNATISNPEEYLRKWFLGSPASNIKRENVKEFFLWAFFNRSGLPGEDEEELEECVKAMERMLGRRLEAGRGSAKCLRLTLDEVKMLHRSIMWYFCVSFVDFLTCIRLCYFGFGLYRTSLTRFFTLFPFRPTTLLCKHTSPVKHLSYWHRRHTSKTRRPVIFIHGIGIGLYPYVDFLSEIKDSEDAYDQIGIIAIEIMPVSFRITHPVLAKDVMCAEIHEIVKHHDWKNFVLVSHSYGTAISTHLLAYEPIASQIASLVLIDPITILLHLPDVAFNFTKRVPRKANEHQLHYFASMDMGVSHALSRYFFWSDSILWKEDINDRRATIVLAQRDLIINTAAVREYIASNYVEMQPPSIRLLEDSRTDGYALSNTNSHAEYRSAAKESLVKCFKEKTRSNDWRTRTWRGKGLDLIWNEGIDHAQVFDTPRTRRLVIAAIQSYCTL